jgi:guanosine-3',5'-bis(diphosphate) 3'-pyrophosphohydrolase
MRMADLHLLLNAIAFAARAHDGQRRKDSKTPYVSHVFRVAMIVRDLFDFDDPRMLLTAVLHDTIEDTTTDFDDLEERFGAEVATWVGYLSKDKRLAEVERERVYIERLKSAPWQVQICKLADMLDNLMDAAHLTSDQQAHQLQRVEQYFAALRETAALELAKPLALVGQKLAEQRSKLAKS